jgi:hypothetical protein
MVGKWDTGLWSLVAGCELRVAGCGYGLRVAGHSNVESGMRNGECWRRENRAKRIAGELSGYGLLVINRCRFFRIRPALARRLQLNSTEVERLRSWSFIDDPHKTGLGQGSWTRRRPKGRNYAAAKDAEGGK